MPPNEIAWFIQAEKDNPSGRGMYARVSLNRDNLSQSVDHQLNDCRDYFVSHGWETGQEFQDDNISASEYTTKERPGFIRLLSAIRKRQLWYILVTEPSRITRVLEVGLEFVKLAREVGGVIVETTEGKRFDLMTNMGEGDFLRAVLDAKMESGIKSDRIRRNKRNVALEGRFHGGRPRYGRVRAEKDKFGRVTNTGVAGTEIHEPEAVILRAVVQRVADGDALLSIVRDLHDDGVLGVAGIPFTAPVLRKTISSPHLIGAASYQGRIVNDHAFPPIVEREIWDKAMLMLQADDRMKGSERKGWGSYLLTGRVMCLCGNPMTAHARDDGKGSTRTYLCRPYDNTGTRIGCNKRRLAEPVELMVADYVKAKFNSDEFKEALRLALQEDGDDELGVLLDRIRQLESKLHEMEDAYVSGGFDLKQLGRMQAAVNSELSQARAKAQRMLKHKGVAAVFDGTFDQAWDLADRHQRRQFLDLIGLKVTVHPRDPKAARQRWTHSGKTWTFEPSLVVITSDF